MEQNFNYMELIANIKINSAGQIFIEASGGNSFDMSQHVGKYLYAGDYDALIKELHELRKDKERLDFMMKENNLMQVIGEYENWPRTYSLVYVIKWQGEVRRYEYNKGIHYASPRAAIDAAIAKSKKN